MTCKTLTPEALAAWIDGALSAEEARDVACHVATCPICHEEGEHLRAQTDALRHEMGREKAPSQLWARISAQLAAEQARPARAAALRARLRRPALAAAVAAMLIVGVVIVQYGPGSGPAPGVALHALAVEAAQDYTTFRLSQRALDVSSDDPTETLLWLGTRINGALPDMAESVLDYRLVGGRLCWLMGQRLGALTYARGPDDQITVYVMPIPAGDDGERALRAAGAKAQHEEGPVRSIVWIEAGLAIAVVSDLPDAEKERFAEALGRSLRPRHPEI